MKMNRFCIITAFLLTGSLPLISQPAIRQTAELKTSLAFTMESGTNGSAVAFNPLEKVYYCVMAGNEEYPLEKLDLKGNHLAGAIAGVDVRGMWWNPKSGSLEVNAFGDLGYYKIDLEENGDPSGIVIQLVSGQNQPSEQSTAAFDPVKQKLFFCKDGIVFTYNLKNGRSSKKKIFLDIPVESEKINANTLIYTGIKGIEFGLLNYVDSELLLFDRKSGKNTGKVRFANNAPMGEALRFSYANQMVWLYNAEYRIWYGYDIFK
jgi:hypothetical protein